MRSRIYSSKFYPPEYLSSIISTSNDIFDDLEKSNAERVAYQKVREEIKKSITNGQHICVAPTEPSEIIPKQSKVSIVKLIDDDARFEFIFQDENVTMETIYATRRPKTTIFSIIYENGAQRDVEVLNGSYLFRFLMSQRRKF